MKAKDCIFFFIAMIFILIRPLFAQTGVDTRLVFISNTYNTPSAGQGTLIVDVEAQSLDAVSYNINLFQDAFQLDANLQAQYISSTFSNQIFLPTVYTTTEDYRASDGRIRYVYTYNSGTKGVILTSWTKVVRISIIYTMSGLKTTLTWFSGLPNYGVTDNNDVVRTGAESAIPAELTDVSLPVQMGKMEATAMAGEGIVLSWRTESEANSAGFHVWRSQSENGSYGRVSTSLINSQGNGSAAAEYKFVDKNVQDGNEYWYKIEEISTDGQSEFFGPISVRGIPLPTEYAMFQNYPNPFNPVTTIKYELPEISDVSVKVYSLLGKEVKTLVNKIQNAGRYTVTWNGSDETGKRVSSGIYFVRIQAGSFSQIRKMTFIQ